MYEDKTKWHCNLKNAWYSGKKLITITMQKVIKKEIK